MAGYPCSRIELYPSAPQRLKRVKRTGERKGVGLSTKGQSLFSLQLDSLWLPDGFLHPQKQDREHALVVSYALETPKSPFYAL
jgi:hypothetical protein